jgi:hypothetical protein
MMLRTHPRNRRCEWSSPAPPYRLISEEQARCWNDNGFFLLRDAFTPAEIAAVLAEIDPIEERVADFLRNHPQRKVFIAEDGNITFTTHLVTMSPPLRDFCRHPVFCDLAHDLIGANVGLTSVCTGIRPSTRSPSGRASSRGIRTTATPTSSRSST